MLKVPCPTCQKEVEWRDSSTFRPFCSKRCQLIDLGEWAAEGHVISEAQPDNAVMKPADIDVEDIEAMLAAQNDDSFFKQD